MKITNKINEAITNVQEVEDKLQGVTDPVMAKAKLDDEEAVKRFEKIVFPDGKFDRKKPFTSGEHQPKPEEAEKELEEAVSKLNLNESLFGDPDEEIVLCDNCQDEAVPEYLTKTNHGWLCPRCKEDMKNMLEPLIVYAGAEYWEEHGDDDMVDEDEINEDMFVKTGLDDESAYDAINKHKANIAANKNEYSDDIIDLADNKIVVKNCKLSTEEALKLAKRLEAIAKDLEFRSSRNESLEEAIEYQNKLVDKKSGEEVIISGKNKAEADRSAKAFKMKNGGESKFTDSGAQRINDASVKQVSEDMDESYDDVETFCSKDMPNGNAFWIIGYCANAMKECGLSDEIGEMRARAMSGDYDNLCAVCDESLQRCNEIAESLDDDYKVEGLEFVTAGLDLTESVDKSQLPAPGTRLRIISMEGEPHYDGREGEVLDIDDIGQIHGTWGGLAIVPEVDKYEIIG